MKSLVIWLTLSAIIVCSAGWKLLSRGTRSLTAVSEAMTLVLSEDFSAPSALNRFKQARPDLGFKAGSADRPAWRVHEGKLIGEEAHNATLWLQEAMPDGDVRVTFTARALSDEGDVKCEFAGDGALHQSGYVLINGGWKNSLRVIARQDEHGEDRREDRRCRAQKCAPQDQEMRWALERRGDVLSWYLDGQLTLRYVDHNPLRGQFFGFGNWSAPVAFDDLKVYRLEAR